MIEEGGQDFYERNGNWQVTRELKKKKTKDLLDNKYGYQCTFTPNTNKRKQKKKDMDTMTYSVQKHIERQKSA